MTSRTANRSANKTAIPVAGRVGFACSYTPLPLIHAAGLVPFRMLPLGDAPDQAGTLLHDNLCPQVKRILDRGLAGLLPDLAGLVLVNSCDAMRRLADAWGEVRPQDRLFVLDLPVTADEAAVDYLARQLVRLSDALSSWSGRPFCEGALAESNRLYRDLAACLSRAQQQIDRQTLQLLLNRSVTESPDQVLRELAAATEAKAATTAGVPVFLFGNVLPDPEAFQLFDRCGARVVGDDLCTGSRQLFGVAPAAGAAEEGEDQLTRLARATLTRPLCARTLFPGERHRLSDQVVGAARQSGARGVIGHVVKFCDPYLARLPAIRDALRAAELPLLVLEGDCTMRSLGQHRTRIEAFVEMLQEG